jgi:hypothetical protein
MNTAVPGPVFRGCGQIPYVRTKTLNLITLMLFHYMLLMKVAVATLVCIWSCKVAMLRHLLEFHCLRLT